MNKTFPLQPEVKKAFDGYNKQERIRLYKIACWFVVLAMPAGIFLDMNIYPQYVPYFLKLRLVSSFLAMVLFGLFYTDWGIRYHRVLCFILPSIPQGFITWMIYATEGAVSPYYAGLNLVLLAMCLLLPWTYQETLSVSTATIIIYVAACVEHGGASRGGIFFSNFYFLFSTAVFAVVGSYFTNRLRVREFIARYELDKSQKQLEESNRKLVELDRMKTHFFANISHELRTPLTLLIAPLEALLAQPHLLDESTREILKTMQVNAMRLLKLINDLLDLVKLESGRIELQQEPLKVGEFIKGMIFSVQGMAKDKRVNLSFQIDEKIGTILADPDKLEKIILNLVFNSVKFTPAGGTVELSAAAEEGFLILRVKDTGMGISEQDLLHVFDRFWQADSSARRKYQGTGIGLALVRELAEAQGGSVTAESHLGKGTLMTVRIRAEKTTREPVREEPAAGSTVDSPASSEWLAKLYRRAELFPAMTPLGNTLLADNYGKGKRPRILVADDEPDMLRFLKSQLEKHYEVLEAVDGNQAVEKARQFLPDLILLDMMMPEKDGIEACGEIKNQTSTQAIPVILLTARADDETKMKALEAGANDFLSKPFSTTELHVRVKNLVESHHYQLGLAREKNALESTLEQLKETEAQLVQNEKMASLGRLSAGLIHEINNPLNYAAQALYLLKTKKDQMPEVDRAKYVEVLSDIDDGIQRVKHIVTDLRTFTHPHSGGGKDRVEIQDLVDTALRFLSHELKDNVKVELEIPKDQAVLVDRNKLVQVFLNLIQNACDALSEKNFENEEPRLLIQSREEKEIAVIRIRDNGPGIDSQNLDKIFDPFFTTKDVGRGMGLGLSLCFRLLQEQGGSISVKTEKGKFTEFTLQLPKA